MKKPIKYICGAAVAAVLTQSLQAVPITGSIGFTGNATYDTSYAGTATEVTSWITPEVTAVSGAFASYITPIIPAVFSPAIWTFNTVTPINSFWSAGGFTFQLLSSSIVSQGGTLGVDSFVIVSGVGIVSGNGFTPTSINWSFSSRDPFISSNPTQWTFSASESTVPDGASTLLLLGAGLSLIVLLQKRLTANQQP